MKGKVVLVRFPFDDFSAAKVRPAVCLTDLIGAHRHVVVAFITSRAPAELLDSDVVISNTDPDFEETGLRVSSTLRLHRLMTITFDVILRELGALASERLVKVDEKLLKLFRCVPAPPGDSSPSTPPDEPARD
jgi:mRNA interferase MazF